MVMVVTSFTLPHFGLEHEGSRSCDDLARIEAEHDLGLRLVASADRHFALLEPIVRADEEVLLAFDRLEGCVSIGSQI